MNSSKSGGGSHKRKIYAAVVFLIAVFFVVSCKGLELENKTEIVDEYTKEQAMILIANERNRYENIYSGDIWQISVGEDGSGFDKLTVQNVKLFMEQMKLLVMLAEERGVSTTSQERDVIRQLTDKYMEGLSEGDLDYIGCDRSDAQKVYTDYFTADKLLKTITGEVDSEISDSEVKVIKIQQICTSDLKKAKAILKRVKIDGESFSSMASRYNESDEVDVTLMKGGRDDLIERTAFGLEEGDISNILAVNGWYYIIDVVDGYAEDETYLRKERIEKALNSRSAAEVIEPYKKEHNIRFLEKFWNEIDFGSQTSSTVENFFDLYEEMVNQGGIE